MILYSYALNFSAEYVEYTFNMTFDGVVVKKVTDTMYMFCIEIEPNRRMKEFLEEIKEYGCSRLYFKVEESDHYWDVQRDVQRDQSTQVLKRETKQLNIEEKRFDDFMASHGGQGFLKR